MWICDSCFTDSAFTGSRKKSDLKFSRTTFWSPLSVSAAVTVVASSKASVVHRAHRPSRPHHRASVPRIIAASSPSSPVVVDVPVSPSRRPPSLPPAVAPSPHRRAPALRVPVVVHAQGAWHWACRPFDIQSSVRLPKPARFGASGLLGNSQAACWVGLGVLGAEAGPSLKMCYTLADLPQNLPVKKSISKAQVFRKAWCFASWGSKCTWSFGTLSPFLSRGFTRNSPFPKSSLGGLVRGKLLFFPHWRLSFSSRCPETVPCSVVLCPPVCGAGSSKSYLPLSFGFL